MEYLIKNETNKYAKRFYTLLMEEGYKITGKNKYKNARTSVEVICSKGHKNNIEPNGFVNERRRCRDCYYIESSIRQRKTQEQFEKEVYKMFGNEYSVIGDYLGTNTHIDIRHNTCGREYSVYPHSILNGTGCLKCSSIERGKSITRTQNEFKKEVYDLTGDEYSVMGEYKGAHEYVLIRHNLCGDEWTPTANSFLRGIRCPKCATENSKISKEKFESVIRTKANNKYKIIGEYVDYHTPVAIKHLSDSCDYYEWDVTPRIFSINGTRCPKCAFMKNADKLRMTQQEFESVVKDKYKSEYSVAGEYTGTDNLIEIIHNNCGQSFNITPYQFTKQNSKCPVCFTSHRKNTEVFKKQIFALVGTEYDLLNEYVNDGEHVKIKHLKCSHEYSVTPSNFLGGKRCPHCNSSKGEKSVYDYLVNNSVPFEREYTFEDCVNKRPLPFDFAVFGIRGNVKMLIEFDGKHHYEPIEYYGGQERFEYVQRNDKIKNDYCYNNEITLLRIPYWDINNIHKILDAIFKN